VHLVVSGVGLLERDRRLTGCHHGLHHVKYDGVSVRSGRAAPLGGAHNKRRRDCAVYNGVLSGLGLTISATLPPRGWVSSMHFVGLLALARPPRPPCMSVATVARLSRRIPRRVPPAVGRMSLATSSEGLSFRLHSLLSKTLLSGSVRPGTPRCEWQNCLSERFRFVSEADRDEILEERIEPLDVARRVGRNVAPTR